MVRPNELDGLEAIWSIALDATDHKVIEKVNSFLIKVFTSVTYKLEPFVHEFEDNFLKVCFDGIEE